MNSSPTLASALLVSHRLLDISLLLLLKEH